MPTQVQWRGGDTTQNNNFTGAAREVTVNEDNNSLRVHDGSTQGGFELARADLSNATGITTFATSGDVLVGGALTATGAITATAGFNIGISSASSSITPGPINTLNFVGVGNTFSLNGTTVNISIPGQTDISYISSTRTINSSTGIGTEIPLVTTTNPGLASTTDKEKIDASASIGLAAGLSIALG